MPTGARLKGDTLKLEVYLHFHQIFIFVKWRLTVSQLCRQVFIDVYLQCLENVIIILEVGKMLPTGIG